MTTWIVALALEAIAVALGVWFVDLFALVWFNRIIAFMFLWWWFIRPLFVGIWLAFRDDGDRYWLVGSEDTTEPID